jgi:predicted TIM-barrel fold metal-dependent hydrolase
MMIDAQIHVWQSSSPERPWPDGAVSLQGEPFSIDQALATLDEGGVQRAILVPPSWVGLQNGYALEAAAREPGRFAVMGRFDPLQQDGPARLRELLAKPGVLGLRMMLNTPALAGMIEDPAVAWFWSQCEAASVPLMCFTPANVKALEPLAAHHPHLRIIVDHSGRNPRGAKDGAAWEDLSELLALARYPNVAVKVSSLPSFSSAPYPFEVLHMPIRAMYDSFGAARLLWGSDVTRLTCPYRDNVRLFTEALDFLSKEDRAWIMGKSATTWCKWP